MKTFIITLLVFMIGHVVKAQPDYEKRLSLYVKAQKLGLTGAGTKIAILDVGAISHGTPGDDTWIGFDYGYNFIDDNTNVSTSSPHGNFVLTQIKSSEGVSPGAEVHVLKVSADDGTPDSNAIKAAFQYCIDSSIDIINMSFQFTFGSFNTRIQELANEDIVVVAASGNSVSESQTSVPASYPNVIAVNAIDSTGGIYVSNVIAPSEPSGSHGINIAASGRFCYVIGNSNIRVTSSGTSFSSPWVAGLFAIYKERYPTMTNYALMQFILDRALKQPNTLYFGGGRPTF